ncbi:MAG: hypothetical protein HKM93_01680, partial [Desulfobacteraceae bacterium]|nr:hypothetical protein [Desulfobacteraceae bacterium]
VLSYWKLNETIAGNYIDNIGNFNAVCDGTCPSTETDGVVNRAQRFDGVGTGITVSPDDAFNWASDADFSIEMWVKRDASPMNPGGEVLVGRIDDTTLMEWRIEIRTNDKKAAFKLVATNGTGSATEHIAVSSKIIANDKWHHIVAIRDAALNTNVLYVDGEEEASVQSLAYDAGFGSATSGLNIGWINDTQDGRLKGALDEVAIYNRVLTEKEIKSHYYLARGYCNELDTQIKIMPMGDSITKDRLGIGDTRPNAIRIGYRKQLYDDLFNNDYWFDLVGSEEDGDETLFDNDHAAWGGIDVENLYDILHSGQNTKVGEEENITYPTPYLDVYPTEFILLHIGTNDVSAHGAGFPNTEMSFLNQILDEIDQASQQTTVLLAKIINRAPGGNNADTIDFNAAVDTLAHTRVLNGDKIIVVNMEEDAGLDYMIDNLEPYTRDFRDNLHPNPKGYPKMGSHWFSILDTVLPRFSAPLVTSDAIELAEVDGLYSYTVTASGTAPFTFSLEEAPAGMVIDELSGLIEWTPVTEGNFDVTVRVVNAMPFGAIGEDFQSFSIDVVPALVITGQAELTTPVNVPISIALTDLEIEGTDTAFPDGYTLTIFDGSNYSVNNNQITPTSQFNGRLSVPLRINNGIRQSNVFNLSVDVLPGSGSGGGGGGGGCFISNLHFN